MAAPKTFEVHAFARKVGGGNPAGVCLHAPSLADDEMRRIARDLGPSVTAFVEEGEADLRPLRWFTRLGAEVQTFCGHATFAAAHVVLAEVGRASGKISFATISGVRDARLCDGEIELAAPVWPAVAAPCPPDVAAAVGSVPQAFLRSTRDLLLVYGAEADILALRPDFAAMLALGDVGVIATAPGGKGEVVYRFFCPGFRIGEDEDLATGSAHSTLAPYWFEALGRDSYCARQVSERGGTFAARRAEAGVMLRAPCATVRL